MQPAIEINDGSFLLWVPIDTKMPRCHVGALPREVKAVPWPGLPFYLKEEKKKKRKLRSEPKICDFMCSQPAGSKWSSHVRAANESKLAWSVPQLVHGPFESPALPLAGWPRSASCGAGTFPINRHHPTSQNLASPPARTPASRTTHDIIATEPRPAKP